MKRISGEVCHSVTLLTRRLSLALIALFVLGVPLGVVARAAQADCNSVQGTVVGHSTGPTSFIGTATGDLAGSATGTNFQIVKVSGDRTFHFVVDHTFTTPQGEIYATALEGVLSPMAPPIYLASEHNVVTGGTGAYAGATGYIDIHGTIDLSTGQFSVSYHGQVCTGQ
jgi:hypothetical protein